MRLATTAAQVLGTQDSDELLTELQVEASGPNIGVALLAAVLIGVAVFCAIAGYSWVTRMMSWGNWGLAVTGMVTFGALLVSGVVAYASFRRDVEAAKASGGLDLLVANISDIAGAVALLGGVAIGVMAGWRVRRG